MSMVILRDFVGGGGGGNCGRLRFGLETLARRMARRSVVCSSPSPFKHPVPHLHPSWQDTLLAKHSQYRLRHRDFLHAHVIGCPNGHTRRAMVRVYSVDAMSRLEQSLHLQLPLHGCPDLKQTQYFLRQRVRRHLHVDRSSDTLFMVDQCVGI